MRVLVCGGRDWGFVRPNARLVEAHRALRERKRSYDVLDRLHHQCPIDLIIHGNARGADRLAKKWAIERRVEHHPFKADWERLGKAAGVLRNQQMIDEGHPDLGVAFPGGRGTNDMVSRLYNANIEVLLVADEVSGHSW